MCLHYSIPSRRQEPKGGLTREEAAGIEVVGLSAEKICDGLSAEEGFGGGLGDLLKGCWG